MISRYVSLSFAMPEAMQYMIKQKHEMRIDSLQIKKFFRLSSNISMRICFRILLLISILSTFFSLCLWNWRFQSKKILIPIHFVGGIENCANLNCSRSVRCMTNNTICCSSILKRSLLFVDTFFHRHNLSYAIVYGTLLGAVRNETIIPWTQDIDIAFFNKTYLYTTEVRNELHQYGYHIFEAIDLTRLCIHRNASDPALIGIKKVPHVPLKQMHLLLAYVDLYIASINEKEMTTANKPIYSIEFSGNLKSSISLQTNVQIDRLNFTTVDNIEEHLVRFYTTNFMHEVVPKNLDW